MLEYGMTCHSGGTLEIYVEPYLPKPQLVLIGHGPVVETLATLGRAADFTVVTLVADTLQAGLEEQHFTGRASVVVATHADSDEEALEQVLGSGAGYISVVASRRRAAMILERLKQRGVPPERLARLKAPAGLDIGAVTPEEIAVSILAEIIQHHRSEKDAWPETEHRQAAARVTEGKDPICGMLVEVGTAGYRSEVSGQLVYFCCRSCKETFDRDPARHLAGLGG